jgi:glycosyltransferase A (GT-A) superfamily protein (DUF2064 family)
VPYKKLGILVRTSVPAGDRNGVFASVAPEDAKTLREAFLKDLFARLSKLKKVSVAVFHTEPDTAALEDAAGGRFPFVAQIGVAPEERIENAFRALFARDEASACVMGAGSPDLPLAFVKRAFVQLKHKETVIGPSLGGGCYLVGLKRFVPEVVRGITWENSGSFRDTLGRVGSQRLSLGLLPPWYDVGDAGSLSLLETLIAARKAAGGEPLPRVERALEAIRGRSGKR